MRYPKLGLTSKGLWLVAIPLVVQIVLLFFMAVLLNEKDAQARKLDRYRSLMNDAAKVEQASVECGRTLMLYATLRTPEVSERYDRRNVEIQQRLRNMMVAVRGNPKQQEALERLELVYHELSDISDRTKQMIEHNGALGQMRELTPENMAAVSRRMLLSLEAFVGEVNQTGRIDPNEGERLGWLIKLCLGAGIAVSVGFVVAAVLFYRRITRRLYVLMDNSDRLSAGADLNPTVSGDDEITSLDKSFHRMAGVLKETARKERALVDNAKDVICSVDAGGRFQKVNPAARSVFGYSPEEMITQPLAEFVLESDRERVSDALHSIQKAGAETTSFECQIAKSDGSAVHVLWSAHWSETEKSYFCVVHDITDRKELERLRQQFAAMISHDLRTPLTSMKGYLSLLTDGVYGDLNEQGRRSTRLMEGGLDRLLQLINELLDIEKMTDGKLDMSFSEVSVSGFVSDSIESVRSYAEQQKVKLLFDPGDETAFADYNRMIQVMINLLGNAIKFSPPEGSVIVSVLPQGDMVRVNVTDSGRGIPAEHVDKIFDRFHQVDARKDQKLGGSGLGLTISKAIVEQHGGTIGVESKEGSGSTFWFTLPAHEH